MKKNTTSKLWIIVAISFIISGVVGESATLITLGCAFTVFGCHNMNSKAKNNISEK